MAADKVFQWRNDGGGIDIVTAEDIQRMNFGQFAFYDNRFVNVIRNRRYDVAVIKANTTLANGTKKQLFRKGLGDPDSYWSDPATSFTKTLVHTNMIKSGEFDEGDLVIVKGLYVEVDAFGGVPAARAAGVTTNPKVTFPATYDPAVLVNTLLNQIYVQWREGNKIVCENKARYYPQAPYMFASFGANAGAVVSNGAGAQLLPNPRVLSGGRDFSVHIENLSDIINTTAAGLDQDISFGVCLDTIEVTQAV